MVIAIRPVACEFEAVTSLFAFAAAVITGFPDMLVARGIRVIFRMCAVGYYEYLNIFIQTRCRPKAVALIASDLIECLADCHTAALQFNMYQRQPVDQYGNVITCFVLAASLGILIDYLQAIVVNVFLVQ